MQIEQGPARAGLWHRDPLRCHAVAVDLLALHVAVKLEMACIELFIMLPQGRQIDVVAQRFAHQQAQQLVERPHAPTAPTLDPVYG